MAFKSPQYKTVHFGWQDFLDWTAVINRESQVSKLGKRVVWENRSAQGCRWIIYTVYLRGKWHSVKEKGTQFWLTGFLTNRIRIRRVTWEQLLNPIIHLHLCIWEMPLFKVIAFKVSVLSAHNFPHKLNLGIVWHCFFSSLFSFSLWQI